MTQSSVQPPSVMAERIYHPSLGVLTPLIRGAGDRGAWERSEAVVQTKRALYGHLHAACSCHTAERRSSASSQTGIQDAKGSSLLSFVKPRSPNMGTTPLPMSSRAAN